MNPIKNAWQFVSQMLQEHWNNFHNSQVYKK